MQLNFFDANNLANDVDQIQNISFAYYRVFCFLSTDSINTEQRSSIFETLRQQLTDSIILLVHYNTSDVSTFIDTNYYYSNEKSNQEPFIFNTHRSDYRQMNLFDQTFGEYERMQPFVMQRLMFAIQLERSSPTRYAEALVIWMHYYHLRLNNSFINATWFDYSDKDYPPIYITKHCTLQSWDYYKELSHTYQCRADGNP